MTFSQPLILCFQCQLALPKLLNSLQQLLQLLCIQVSEAPSLSPFSPLARTLSPLQLRPTTKPLVRLVKLRVEKEANLSSFLFPKYAATPALCWTSRSSQEEQACSGPSFFSPLFGSFHRFFTLAAAIVPTNFPSRTNCFPANNLIR